METILLLSVAILLPVFCAALCFIVRGKTGRSIIVVPASIIFVMTAINLLNKLIASGGKIVLAFETHLLDINWFVELCIIALLIYIIYIGFSRKKFLVSLLALLQLVPMMVFEIFQTVKEPVNIFVIDYLSLVMILLISIISPVIMIFALGHMPKVLIIMFIFLGAMNGLVILNNLLWMYLFWCITALCSYGLIANEKTKDAIKNALRALCINLLGGVAFVLGIIFIYNSVGTLAIDEITRMKPGAAFTGLLPIGLGFLCAAGFTRSAQLPFQSWLLGAMALPSSVSGILHSTVIVNTGVYLIVRFAPAFSNTLTGTMVAIAGGFTFLAGSVLAAGNKNAKRILVYSTIANIGLIICCAGIGTEIAKSAAIMLIIFHVLSKSLLFLCAAAIEQGIGSSNVDDMQGLLHKMPFVAVIAVFGMVTMLLPPFGVMFTKLLAIEAAAHMPLILGLIILGSAFTVYFWARWIGIILNVSNKTKYVMEKLRLSVRVTIALLAGLVLAAGILVKPLFNILVSPQLTADVPGDVSTLTGGNSGIIPGNGNSISMGGFTSVGVLIIVFAVVVTILHFINKMKPERIVPPYLGGGQASDDIGGLEFIGPGDKRERAVVHNYDFIKLPGEDKLTFYANLAAAAIILIMFGVVV